MQDKVPSNAVQVLLRMDTFLFHLIFHSLTVNTPNQSDVMDLLSCYEVTRNLLDVIVNLQGLLTHTGNVGGCPSDS